MDIVDELRRRTLAIHGGTANPMECHWNLTEIDSMTHKLAADELQCLRGERAVFAELLDAAAQVIHTLDGEDTDEESRLRGLQERLERAALEARGVTANDQGNGPRQAQLAEGPR